MKNKLVIIRNKIFGINKIESLFVELVAKIDLINYQLADFLPTKTYESFDVRLISQLEAGMASARLFNEHLYDKKIFESDLDLLSDCADQVDGADLILEFGVFSGRTINRLADKLPNHQVWGFDSFEGLPETWRNDFVKGAFKVDALPQVRANVVLVKGWFDETLPEFLRCNANKIGLLHIDCDLYSSTKTVLGLLKDRFKTGSIIVFDEYFNYPGWEQHEFKAFAEFVAETGYAFEYVGCNPRHQQVAVRLFC